MKLKNIYKYYLLLIFLNCHDNRNCKIQNLKNYNQSKKLSCNCPRARYAPPTATATATLCPKQETRPAKVIKSRLKLQGRKPKFKLATSENRAQMQHANDNEIDNDKGSDDDDDAWIEHLTAKVASGSDSDSGSDGDGDNSSDSGSSIGSDVGNYLRQQLNTVR